MGLPPGTLCRAPSRCGWPGSRESAVCALVPAPRAQSHKTNRPAGCRHTGRTRTACSLAFGPPLYTWFQGPAGLCASPLCWPGVSPLVTVPWPAAGPSLNPWVSYASHLVPGGHHACSTDGETEAWAATCPRSPMAGRKRTQESWQPCTLVPVHPFLSAPPRPPGVTQPCNPHALTPANSLSYKYCPCQGASTSLRLPGRGGIRAADWQGCGAPASGQGSQPGLSGGWELHPFLLAGEPETCKPPLRARESQGCPALFPFRRGWCASAVWALPGACGVSVLHGAGERAWTRTVLGAGVCRRVLAQR
nr:uncharacterized protein LOC122172847 [Chrysemys picta bellii]